MNEDKPMTLKDWISSHIKGGWDGVQIYQNLPKDHLSRNMKDIYEEPDFFNFYVWTKENVFAAYVNQDEEYGWALDAYPRHPYTISLMVKERIDHLKESLEVTGSAYNASPPVKQLIEGVIKLLEDL